MLIKSVAIPFSKKSNTKWGEYLSIYVVFFCLWMPGHNILFQGGLLIAPLNSLW